MSINVNCHRLLFSLLSHLFPACNFYYRWQAKFHLSSKKHPYDIHTQFSLAHHSVFGSILFRYLHYHRHAIWFYVLFSSLCCVAQFFRCDEEKKQKKTRKHQISYIGDSNGWWCHYSISWNRQKTEQTINVDAMKWIEMES